MTPFECSILVFFWNMLISVEIGGRSGPQDAAARFAERMLPRLVP